ncbi:MAG: hypothetical protein IPJ37_15710 [Bacteroidales bacterium]|nr:hypothetical protein [Bacteroidales bacterium]
MTSKGEILAAILKNFRNCYFFLHNTREADIAEKIMNEGFIFENQLVHSTDRVNPNEPIEITYFLFQRKDYGSYTIVIAIPRITYEGYSALSSRNAVSIEEVMTIADPYFSDNDELMFTVSPKHVLGYFNNKTSEFFQNGNWDPFFNNSRSKSQKKRSSRHGRK